MQGEKYDYFPPESVGRIHRRAIFSSDIFRLESHSIDQDNRVSSRSRLKGQGHRESSSHLLDDLINHPMDPLFEDSTLTVHMMTPARRWLTRIVSFILCIFVGIMGAQAIRVLQINTREKIRAELASQLTTRVEEADKEEKEVSALRAKISALISSQSNSSNDASINRTQMMNATTKVSGRGITMTLSNTVKTSDDDSDSARVTDGQSAGNVSDIILQVLVSRLWAGGAEAISVNNVRLGPQTSIRLAGESILVGVTVVSSPYKIKAIGKQSTLTSMIDEKHNPKFYKQLKTAGISASITNSQKLTLKAVSSAKLDYAHRKKK